MKLKVGILGATGMVGQRFIQCIQEHPCFEISALAASEKSAGSKYKDVAKWYLAGDMPEHISGAVVEEIDTKIISKYDLDIVFSAIPSKIAGKVESDFAKHIPLFSNTATYRMTNDVPLVIPEVNPEHLNLIKIQKEKRKWKGFIVTNPNCTTIGFVLPLKPLMDNFGIEYVNVATMQALSGAGYDGVPSMAIIDNIIPFIRGEEEKVEIEGLKILGKFNNKGIDFADFSVIAACNRIPVLDGHTESVFVKLKNDFEITDVIKIFNKFGGVPQEMKLPTAPKRPLIVLNDEDRPQPRLDRDRGNGMSISVGRFKKNKDVLKFTCVSHNTIRGAAGASVLNAELALKKGWI
ncbi:aspartate-semialdehyde dehydrogenase [Candidatus Altiarchaeales archaeon WOR_SM1_SCG]|nr:aspartate-semialdehyde dehydrogenase [Candidatus Altiarchaeales archaeon WOR_SM1_SCG]